MEKGVCPVCGYSFRLTRIGVLVKHHLYAGLEALPTCEGSGREPVIPPAPAARENEP